MSDQYQGGYVPPQQQPQDYQQQPTHQPAPQQEFYQQQQAMAQGGQGIQAVDSLSTNEFAVELNGERVTGVFSVSGLSSYSLKLDDAKPVGMDFPPFTITKMVQQDPNLTMNQWTRETVAARGTRLPTRDVAIVALDEGIETRRWVYRNCWISGIRFSDFDTGLDFLIEEKITIQHGGVEEIWPAR